MKTRMSLSISMLALIFALSPCFAGRTGNANDGQQKSINIISTPEMFSLASEWCEDYRGNHPEIQINLKKLEISSADNLMEKYLVFLSEEDVKGNVPSWKMTVGREVVVLLINAGNPYAELLAGQGITRDKLADLLEQNGSYYWNDLVAGAGRDPVHVYLSGDKTVIRAIEKYLGLVIKTESVKSDRVTVTDIQNDPLAIGFCKLSSILVPEKSELPAGVTFLPIDRNGNGKLDYIENIYADPGSLVRGVWIGKYPQDLSRDFYVAAVRQPDNSVEVEFLEWMLTGGQSVVARAGYTDLAYSEAQSKLGKLTGVKEPEAPVAEGYSLAKIILFIIVVTLSLSIMIGAIAGFRRQKAAVTPPANQDTHPGFDDHTVSAPRGLFYDRTHTWAFMEKDGTVRIGIDDFLQKVTGTITRVEMKMAGEKVKKGDILVTLIQQGKQLTIYAPVTGTIQENNRELQSNPSLINISPYHEGWIYRIDPASWLREITLLNMAGKYTRWLGDEIVRLKDFLAFSSQSRQLHYLDVLLQDGGQLKKNLLEDFGPEVWEDFQVHFLDKNR